MLDSPKMSFGRFSAVIAASSLALAIGSSAQAAPLLFDFEELSTGSFTSLLMTRSGYNVSVSRTSGINIDINDISGASPPAGWGSRTLSPVSSTTTNDGFLFDISAPVQLVSIETADFFQDSDIVSLTAYDSPGGTGTVLDSMTINWGNQGPPAVALLTTSSPSIRSVVARGGSSFAPNSMYWDNLTIDPVPGPLPIMGAGVAFGFSRKLRLRIKSSKA
jgi:hypothetical protein